MPTVVDANCIAYFYRDLLTHTDTISTAAILKATSNDFIAIDSDGRARQEYIDCCQPSPLGISMADWLSDRLLDKKVQLVTMDRSLDKNLNRLGLPRKDQKWPAIALAAKAQHIVTEDIDLFCPKAKAHNAVRKAQVKANGSGSVARFLRKTAGIVVCTQQQFIDGT